MESLQMELFSMNILNSLKSAKVQEKIKLISKQIVVDISADHPSVLWNQKKHIVTLPYKEGFSEDDIPTKSRPCQMNVEFCHAPSLHPGRDWHSKTIVGPKLTLGLAYLLSGRLFAYL
uniref:Uncharacterized protein n=1 Tax=Solanum tuberosum TaxID=4113 RepID=M1DQP5_SOLTU